MAPLAVALPIMPGKKDKWMEMAKQLEGGPMKERMDASRRNAGVHERTFLQKTPQGDLVIITLEGDDPAASFEKMMADPSMQEFAAWAADVHGMDPNAPMPVRRSAGPPADQWTELNACEGWNLTHGHAAPPPARPWPATRRSTPGGHA